MSLFWKPKGRPLSVNDLRDGQHVEGYYKEQFGSFWKKMPRAWVQIKPYSESYKDWKIMEILIPGKGYPIRLGIKYTDEFQSSNSTHFRLYDGLIYSKSRRRRFP